MSCPGPFSIVANSHDLMNKKWEGLWSYGKRKEGWWSWRDPLFWFPHNRQSTDPWPFFISNGGFVKGLFLICWCPAVVPRLIVFFFFFFAFGISIAWQRLPMAIDGGAAFLPLHTVRLSMGCWGLLSLTFCSWEPLLTALRLALS